MLRDIRHPQFVGFLARELAADPIRGGGMRCRLPIAGTAGAALDAGRAHQPLDRLVADADPLAEDQIRVHATRAVGAPRGRMDLADQIGQPGVA